MFIDGNSWVTGGYLEVRDQVADQLQHRAQVDHVVIMPEVLEARVVEALLAEDSHEDSQAVLDHVRVLLEPRQRHAALDGSQSLVKVGA